ncbi:hypothetical protein OPT61_g6592 [Boeremia exigua]|uniref:Uncharacterized protein n=1 Tax=Boeremia exigua TaxID=749465 RepID=A0ACC2I5I7_9PLEO|nr:hypothetical protein OPT61_g6592 [Boeremia exigua]
MATKSICPEAIPRTTFSISQDEEQVQTSQRFDPSLSIADRGDVDKENLELSKAHRNKHAINNDSLLSSTERTPLMDVTEEVVSGPRSLSSALVEIANLERELEASKSKNQKLKRKNRKLRGELVAYKDALYQVEKDAGYF